LAQSFHVLGQLSIHPVATSSTRSNRWTGTTQFLISTLNTKNILSMNSFNSLQPPTYIVPKGHNHRPPTKIFDPGINLLSLLLHL
jgi:hypothetical protein